MKKIIWLLIYLVVIFITSCEKEKIIPGEIGIPVYLVPQVEASSDTLGCNFNWSFVERPLNSNLSVLSFQPSNNGYNIYFIPDVSGNYKVKCEVRTYQQKLKQESFFICKIAQGQQANIESPLSGTVTDIQTEDEPVYLEDNDQNESEIQEKTIPVFEEKKKIIAKKTIPKTVRNTPLNKTGLYTIQISSFKKYANAERDMNELKKMGLTDIYIKKTYIKSKDEVWFRVRTNSFSNISSANSTLTKIRTEYKRSTAWLDKID